MSQEFLRWVAPIITALLCIAIPSIIRAAIAGQFAESRNEEVARMAAHNENENSHPRLRVVTEFEERIERAIADLKDEFRAELGKLGEQIQELKEGLNPPAPSPKKKRC